MNKTPEQMAKEYCDQFCWNDPREEDARDAFLAGFQAGVKEAEIRILNEFFDNYGADEHASFALRVNAYQWNDEDK